MYLYIYIYMYIYIYIQQESTRVLFKGFIFQKVLQNHVITLSLICRKDNLFNVILIFLSSQIQIT